MPIGDSAVGSTPGGFVLNKTAARQVLLLSALFGFFSVVLGAFGAHGLKPILDEKSLAIYRTGVEYQYYHTFALALVGILGLHFQEEWLRVCGFLFVAGIFLFSGSLYILALTGVRTWGMVTPVGGILFLAGWGGLIYGLWRHRF